MSTITCVFYIYEPFTLICRDIVFEQQISGSSRYVDWLVLTRLNRTIEQNIDLIRLGERELLESGWPPPGEQALYSSETAIILWTARMLEDLFKSHHLPSVKRVYVYAITGEVVIHLRGNHGREK